MSPGWTSTETLTEIKGGRLGKGPARSQGLGAMGSPLGARDRLHLRVDISPDIVDATADVEHRRDGHQGDEAGKQRILDEILAIGVSEKSDQQPSHVIVPLGGELSY